MAVAGSFLYPRHFDAPELTHPSRDNLGPAELTRRLRNSKVINGVPSVARLGGIMRQYGMLRGLAPCLCNLPPLFAT